MGKDLNLSNIFEQPTHEDVMNPLMGVPSEVAQIPRNVVARPVSIYELQRDPLQPRRAIPSQAALGWDGDPHGLIDVLSRWWGMVQNAAPLADYLEGETPPAATDGSPGAESFIALLGLARSILESGLDNPILITADKKIESGERRWLAYHVLHSYTGDDKWSKIPAREIGQGSVWRQAAENGARENLNAISRARQLARLIMELYREMGHDFAPYRIPYGECDQIYFAQVADGETYPFPPGTKDRLIAFMGVKSHVQLRQYRALLRVPPEVWVQADDENWPEARLRPYTAVKADKGVTSVTPTKAPTLKLTSDLVPKWAKVVEMVQQQQGATTPQNILQRMIECYLKFGGQVEQDWRRERGAK